MKKLTAIINEKNSRIIAENTRRKRSAKEKLEELTATAALGK